MPRVLIVDDTRPNAELLEANAGILNDKGKLNIAVPVRITR